MSDSAPLQCIIIDDNAINRLTLEQFVRITDGLELRASLPDAVALLAYLRQEQGSAVDLLLLDIEMPHLSGLDLLPLLPDPVPQVVMVTSHATFAVEAFALDITDYLLKPLDYARFRKAIDRVRRRHISHLADALLPPATAEWQGPADDPHLFVKTNNKLLRLNFDEVLYIEAMSAYSVLVTATRKHIIYTTLKALGERLPFTHFLRVHRSYIVNTRCIDAIEDGHLQLGAHEVPIGKSYEADLMRKLRSL